MILTTRAQAAGVTARRVGIQEMETKEGALFLLRPVLRALRKTHRLTPSTTLIGRRPKGSLRNSMVCLWPLTKLLPISRRQAVGSLAI